MIKELAVHKHIYWISSYAPGGAQPTVNQKFQAVQDATKWLNSLLSTLGLPHVHPPSNLETLLLLSTDDLKEPDKSDTFVKVQSDVGLEIYFDLRQKTDVVWLYVQLVATKPSGLETAGRIREMFPDFDDRQRMLGEFSVLTLWADAVPSVHEFARKWFDLPQARAPTEVNVSTEIGGDQLSFLHGGAPERALICHYSREDTATLKSVLFDYLPDLARYFIKRDFLFAGEYKSKINPFLHQTQIASQKFIEGSEALIQNGIDTSELVEAEHFIGELVSFSNLFSAGLADAEVVRQSLKMSSRNAEIALSRAPAEISTLYQHELQTLGHAVEQIGFDIERFRTNHSAVSSSVSGLEICSNLLRTRIEDHENRQANVRNYLIAVAGVTLAFAQIFTPDVVVALLNSICIPINKPDHLYIFAVQLVPLILALIIGLIVFHSHSSMRAISSGPSKLIKAVRNWRKKPDENSGQN